MEIVEVSKYLRRYVRIYIIANDNPFYHLRNKIIFATLKKVIKKHTIHILAVNMLLMFGN